MKKLLLIPFVFRLFAFPLFAQTDIEGFIKNAQQLSHQNKFDEAVAEIGKAIAVQPNNPDLYLHRAEYNFLLEKKASVLEDAQKPRRSIRRTKRFCISALRPCSRAGFR